MTVTLTIGYLVLAAAVFVLGAFLGADLGEICAFEVVALLVCGLARLEAAVLSGRETDAAGEADAARAAEADPPAHPPPAPPAKAPGVRVLHQHVVVKPGEAGWKEGRADG